MTKLRLIDSRNRGSTGKREVRIFDRDQHVAIWNIVLEAEVALPEDREDYGNLALYDKGAKLFADYWAEYGWAVYEYEDDAPLRKDQVLVENTAPAPKTFDPPAD